MARFGGWVSVGCCGFWLTWFGCAQEPSAGGTPVERLWEAPAARTDPGAASGPARPGAGDRPADLPPASRPAAVVPPDDVLAVVNGQPIRRSAVLALLMESHGLDTLESLILLEAARQRGAALSIQVTPADVRAAHEDALQRLAMPVLAADRPPLDRAAAQRLLRDFLGAKNISQRQWDLRMEQRAWLARIAAAEVAAMPITDAMLRAQYDQDYGEKVQVRHIQLGSLAQVTRARALLADLDFELVARQMSENEFTASQGGLLPPFTRNDPGVPPLLREVAFGLKPGEVSTALQEQNRYQLLKLEKRFPASSVGFENVDKGKLRAQLIENLARQRMEELETELFRTAAVDIRDEALRARFRERHRSAQR